MKLNIKDGLVQIDETLEDKITDFHLNNGFAMLSAFHNEYTFEQNRSHNKQLASRLKSFGYSFIKVTGYYIDHIEFDKSIIVESFLVPVYDIKTKESADFDTYKSYMIELDKEFGQDSILISPPGDQGNITIASVADTYFSMKENNLNKDRTRSSEDIDCIKFESAWLDEPAHTISGVRARAERNELPPFGSHYYNNSRIYDLTTLE